MVEQMCDSQLLDEAMLAELDVEVLPERASDRSAQQERLITGFEEIQTFNAANKRIPRTDVGVDIFERLLGIRLESLRHNESARAFLSDYDEEGLLDTTPLPLDHTQDTVDAVEDSSHAEQAATPASLNIETLDDEAMLAQLGIDEETLAESQEIHVLRHVRSAEARRTAAARNSQDIAQKQICEDFEHFRAGFEQVTQQLRQGIRQTSQFQSKNLDGGAIIKQGEYFILGGQLLYVAEVGEEMKAPNGESDAKLRVIFDNGTESNLLRRSLQRALYGKKGRTLSRKGRRVESLSEGPLYDKPATPEAEVARTSELVEASSNNHTPHGPSRPTHPRHPTISTRSLRLPPNDGLSGQETGTIYVLRSQSDHPYIAGNRSLIHKIGVTRGSAEKRVAQAEGDPTFLFADVEIVAVYRLRAINRVKLEAMLHRVFSNAQLDITLPDRFGRLVKPREWFLVPLSAIDEAVQRIQDGSITQMIYCPEQGRLQRTQR